MLGRRIYCCRMAVLPLPLHFALRYCEHDIQGMFFAGKRAWVAGMTQRMAETYSNSNDRTRGRDGNRPFSLQ